MAIDVSLSFLRNRLMYFSPIISISTSHSPASSGVFLVDVVCQKSIDLSALKCKDEVYIFSLKSQYLEWCCPKTFNTNFQISKLKQNFIFFKLLKTVY
jgi:hypothetical protein